MPGEILVSVEAGASAVAHTDIETAWDELRDFAAAWKWATGVDVGGFPVYVRTSMLVNTRSSFSMLQLAIQHLQQTQ